MVWVGAMELDETVTLELTEPVLDGEAEAGVLELIMLPAADEPAMLAVEDLEELPGEDGQAENETIRANKTTGDKIISFIRIPPIEIKKSQGM